MHRPLLITSLVSLSALACLAVLTAGPVTRSDDADDGAMRSSDGRAGVIFTVPVGDAASFVVERSDYLEDALPASVRPPPPHGLAERFYEVRAELRAPSTRPVLVAARIRVESGTRPDTGTVVLDHLLEPRRIVLFVAEGSQLFVWQISISQGVTCWTPLQTDKPWPMAAAAYRLDDSLISATLARSNDGRLTIELLEKLSGYSTTIEEIEAQSFRFRLVRQRKVN